MVSTPEHLRISTFLGATALAIGDVAVTDEQAVLIVFLERCRAAGVIVLDRTELLSLEWEPTAVRLLSNRRTIRARIVVDCTGGLSPIAATFQLHRILGFFTIFGSHLTDVSFTSNELILASIDRLGHPPAFFEIMPTSATTALAVVFHATRRALPFDDLARSFREHVANNPYFTAARIDERRLRQGVIPIGKARRRRLPFTESFGEAAMMQPPLIGSAFNDVLEFAHDVAEQIRSALRRGTSACRDFRIRYPLAKRFNNELQWMFARALVDGSLERYDRLVHLAAALEPHELFAFYSNELSLTKILRAGVRMAPRVLTTGDSRV